jgi:hypothetical protein
LQSIKRLLHRHLVINLSPGKPAAHLPLEELWMNEIQDYFVCDSCSNKKFSLVFKFSLRFHGVNFSDDLIYERLNEEIYECTECKKAYTKMEIEDSLGKFKKKYKKH